jgi:hypothetical protein
VLSNQSSALFIRPLVSVSKSLQSKCSLTNLVLYLSVQWWVFWPPRARAKISTWYHRCLSINDSILPQSGFSIDRTKSLLENAYQRYSGTFAVAYSLMRMCAFVVDFNMFAYVLLSFVCYLFLFILVVAYSLSLICTLFASITITLLFDFIGCFYRLLIYCIFVAFLCTVPVNWDISPSPQCGTIQWTIVMNQWPVGTIRWTIGTVQWTIGMNQWTNGMIQWTNRTIQWTFGTIQWTNGMIQWTIGMIQWTNSTIQWTINILQWTNGMVQSTNGMTQ